jgi:uncharacterized protein
VTTFKSQSVVPHPPAAVFAWHARAGAFARLAPPWDATRVVARQGTIRDGERATLQIPFGPLRLSWEAEHFDFVQDHSFRDRQLRGPFSSWQQHHSFESDGAGGCVVRDEVDYRLPLGFLGRWIAGANVQRRLTRVMAHRHAALFRDLERHAAFPVAPMRIAIAGSSGFIGSALSAFLSTGGHQVLRLQRPGSRPSVDAVGTAVAWDPEKQWIDRDALGSVDAFVNLAGANVGARAWTNEYKKELWSSRVGVTQFAAQLAASLSPQPRVFLNGSAIGIYGDRGNTPIDESAAPDGAFLRELGEAWESAAQPAVRAGIRVVFSRTGLVLSPKDGLLAQLLPLFRLGLGARLGSGLQGMSWIAIDDLVFALHQMLCDESMVGPVNATAPTPVSNREFTSTLARVCRRPALLSVPGFAVRALRGELGDEALRGAFIFPKKLQDAGFRFSFPTLELALAHLLGRPSVEV